MRIRFLFAFLLLSSPAWGVNHYILKSASGTGTGADWTNACTDFTGANCAPSSLTRGDTYYVGTGAYTGGYTFNVAASGALVITIKGATIADHGTATGWSNAFSVSSADGGSQATFGYINCSGSICQSWLVTTDYWTINGNVGSGSIASSYGFSFSSPGAGCSTATGLYPLQIQGNNSEALHIAFVGCGPTVLIDQFALTWGKGLCGSPQTNDNSHYLYFSGYQNDLRMYAQVNSLIEYTYHTNSWSDTPSGHHGEEVNAFCTNNIVFRYNTLNQCAGTACIAGNIDQPVAINNWDIYGNLFSNPGCPNCVTPQAIGNGIIAGTSNVIANTRVYNNTFAQGPDGWGVGGPWFYEGNSCAGVCTGNVLYNNVVYGVNCGVPNNGAAVTSDYNTYLSCGSGTPPTETNRQTGNFNPFVNSAANNYHLANDGVASCASTTATCTGNTLSSTLPTGCTVGVNCYNIDIEAHTRAVDGTWERGTYEVTGSTAAAPTFNPVAGTYATTQSVTISTASSGAVICYTTNGSTPATNGSTGCSAGTLYSTPISVSTTQTVKAVAGGTGYADSSVSSALYTITLSTPPKAAIGMILAGR